MKLMSRASQKTLVDRLEQANTLWARTKGLLGRQTIELDQALWITRCNSIHTFFMRFAIDLIFVNRKMVVVKTVADVQPGQVVWPVWSASSVIELKSGFLNQQPIKVGDELYVDRSLS